MSDVSLRSYLKNVDSLIEGNRLEEAKAQARHILSHFPKNGQAYLQLGQVLFAQREFEDAAEVLRRLLGADPLNGAAHQLLSQSYLQLKQLDSAIYHLERAFDQQPNDRQIIATLRDLYGQSRGSAVEKIQLTAGAVAGQYLNNSLPDQAIDILKKAIKRFPDRVDLKLMLAKAYSAAEQNVEAAEAGLDALKVLPYALTANQLLAEFWLAQRRPSDARLYITRIEEVDPYLALKLATGETDENRYILPELDYKRVAEREMSTASPDWLTSFTAPSVTAPVAPVDDFDNMKFTDDDLSWLNADDVAPQVEPSTNAPRRKVTDDLADLLADIPAPSMGGEAAYAADPASDIFSGGLRPDVMRRLEALKGASNDGTILSTARPADEVIPPELDQMLDDFDLESSDWLAAAGIELVDNPGPQEIPSTGLTGLLGQMGDEQADDDSWLNDLSDDVQESDDSLDFLGDIDEKSRISPQSGRVSTGFTDRIEKKDTEVEAASVAEADDEFDFGAMDFGDEFDQPLPTSGANFLDELEYADEPAMATSTGVGKLNSDLLDSGDLPAVHVPKMGSTSFFDELEYVEDAPEVSTSQVGQLDSKTLTNAGDMPSSDSANPLAWMQDTGIEYDPDAENPYDVMINTFDEGPLEVREVRQDPHAWMSQSGVELDPEALHDDDPLSWMKNMNIEDTSTAADAAQQEANRLSNLLDVPSLSTDELNDIMNAPTQGEWQDTMPDDPNWQDNDLDGFEWLSDDEGGEPVAETSAEASASLDWVEAEPESSEFNWEQEVDPQLEASTGFTGMLDNLGASPAEDDPLGWMNKYHTDYLDEASINAALDAPVEDDFSMDDLDQFALTDDALPPLDEAVATEASDFTANFDLQDDAVSFLTDDVGFDFAADDEPIAEGDFSFGDFDSLGMEAEPLAEGEFALDDDLATANDFDFAADLEPMAETDFGFSDADLEGFGMEAEPLAEGEFALEDDLAIANDFDFATDADPVSEGDFAFGMGDANDIEFGFDTSQLEAFSIDEASAESAYVHDDAPVIANGFDFALDDESVEDSEFFFEDALEPTAMADFDLDDALSSETVAATEFDMDAALGEPIVHNDFNFDDDDEFALDEPVASEPDWLSAMEDPISVEASYDEPDWLANVGVGGVAIASEVIADEALMSEEEFDEPLEEDFAAPTRQYVPADDAENAPDWLNSMVPGLDVNYENLPENEIVEEEFNENISHRGRNIEGFTAVNDGYEWLEDIVEEETNGMPPVQVDAAAQPPLAPLPNFSSRAPAPDPVTVVPTKRFVFSRPPAWLNALKEAILGKPEPVMEGIENNEFDEFEDFDFDDNDKK